MTMTLGIMFGAFLYARGGYIALLIGITASVADYLWGAQVGHWLAEQTKAVFQ